MTIAERRARVEYDQQNPWQPMSEAKIEDTSTVCTRNPQGDCEEPPKTKGIKRERLIFSLRAAVKSKANHTTSQKENRRMVFAGRFFPVFDTMPSDEFITRWREHTSNTGMPEEFESVSTTKPAQLENINLLSEEIAVPIKLRPGEDRVPCPFCAPGSPKFIRGRMAYFPDEKAVRFIGHKCAQSHFGDNFKLAEAVFRRQTMCRQYIELWREIGPRYGDMERFLDVMSKSAVDLQFVRDQLDKQATGFAGFLHGELAQVRGELFVKLDLGIKDRNGTAVIQEKLIGTAAGLRFLSRGYDVEKRIRQTRSALSTVEVELPEWIPSSPEHPATAEILKRGRLVEKSIQRIPGLLADINDGLLFLRRKNLSLIHQWGNRMDTPFARFEIKSDDRQMQVRSNSFAGDHYANVLIPAAAKLAPVKTPDPAIEQLIRMVA